VDLERAVLARLGGGCGMPVGAFARAAPEGWSLSATLAADGWEGAPAVRLARADATGPTPAAALDACMATLREAPRPAPRPEGRRLVLVTLPSSSCEAYAPALAEAGWRVLPWELIAVAPTGVALPPRAERARWVAVSSPRAAPFAAAFFDGLDGPLPRVAALGPATARALRAAGLPVHVLAPEGTGAGLAEAIAAFPADPAPILLPQAARALPDLRDGLAKRGFEALPWPVYETRPLPPAPLPPGVEAIVLASPSNVEAFTARGPPPQGVRLVAFGPSTETAMRRAGLPVHAVAPRRSASGLAEALP
jgi:uroporphyrinogen-III synthase